VLALLAVLFLVVPIAELAVIVRVAGAVGVAPTLLVLIAVSVLGAWLVKREGIGIWRRIQRQIGAGQVPGKELVDAFLVLFAGVLLLTPGFLTDALGILLLLPPVRAVVRVTLLRRFTRRAVVRVESYRFGGHVHDVDGRPTDTATTTSARRELGSS
jgi:UPF0716 protein FxsA